MARIASITVRLEDVKAPVYIQSVVEDGVQRWVKFTSAAFVKGAKMKFVRDNNPSPTYLRDMF